MLPFEGYVANKIAQYLTHIEVSSDKSHKGDTVCLCRQRASVLYTSNFKHKRGTAVIRVFTLKCICVLGMMMYLVIIDIFQTTLKSLVPTTHQNSAVFLFY